MLNVKPIENKAYTRKGNEYKKSNLGKYSAAATVGTGATIIAMKQIPFGNFKKPFESVKNVDFAKIKDVKVKKPNFKGILQNMFAGIEKMAVKAQIRLATAKIKPIEFKKPEFIKNFMSKIKKPDFSKLNVMEMLKSPKAAKYSEYAGFVAGAVVMGLAIDFALNKINAYKADKN